MNKTTYYTGGDEISPLLELSALFGGYARLLQLPPEPRISRMTRIRTAFRWWGAVRIGSDSPVRKSAFPAPSKDIPLSLKDSGGSYEYVPVPHVTDNAFRHRDGLSVARCQARE